MCKKRSATSASVPRPRPRSATPSATFGSSGSHLKPSSSTTSNGSSVISLASIQHSLPDRLILYPFPEILAATNNFLLKRYSSSSSWRCKLRDKDVLVFQREFRSGDGATVQDRLSAISRSHHKSLVRLLGASLHAGGDSIFVVYEFVAGASLVDCLRNPRNPNYSALPTWTSRMTVVTDIAQGLEYIHRHSGTRSSRHHAVHNRIKSSSIIVLDHPNIHAKICHFGTAELTGGADDEEGDKPQRHTGCEIESVESKKVKQPSRRRKIENTRGYMAPEVIDGGGPTQKTDVFAFGVVLLELLTGEEPIRYRYDRNELQSVLLIDTARDVMGTEEGEWDEERRRRRLRRWVDRRLKDSFPVDVAEKLLALALECVEAKAVRRPHMEKVAGKLSQFLLKSQEWESKRKIPADFTVSMAPR